MQPAACRIPGIINGDTDVKVWFKLEHNLDKNLNLHWFHSIYKCTRQSHKSPKVVEIASISPNYQVESLDGHAFCMLSLNQGSLEGVVDGGSPIPNPS